MGNNVKLLALALLVAGVALVFLIPAPEPPDEATQRTDLPWQITSTDDGSIQVLDLHLGVSTLQDAVNKLGEVEGIALYLHNGEPGSLEAYFGTVSLGHLKAKIVVNLALPDESKLDMANRATKREPAPNDDFKLTLSGADQKALLGAPVGGLTYIPTYGGLEADFFREKLGEPAAWLKEKESVVLWFYPERGLTLILNADGKEVFEYQRPSEFRLPEGAVKNPN